MKWVVMAERGEYSDKDVWPVAAFDTIDEARAFCAKIESCAHHADANHPDLAKYQGASFEVIGLDLGRMSALVDKWLEEKKKLDEDFDKELEQEDFQ